MTRDLRISRREFGWTASTATVALDQLVSARMGMVRILGSLSGETSASRGRHQARSMSKESGLPRSAKLLRHAP